MDEPHSVALYLSRNLLALRHARNLTQESLAKASSLPRSTIANLESGTGNPSLTVLLKVAGALGVPVDELLAPPRAKVRKWASGDVSTLNRGQGVTLRPLVPEPTPDEMLSIMDFQPRATLRGTPHLPGTREYFTCLDGVVAIAVDGTRFELERGDVLAFPGNVRHSYENPHATRPATGISVVILAKVGV
jgi:XRE family transcriptional regulator, regulator of sulfur utilization